MNMSVTELKDTAQLMSSADYKERFLAEYLQTKLRYDKLHRMCVKYEAGTLEFEPTCSLDLLKEQKAAMGNYLRCLEIRAQIEGVDLADGEMNCSVSPDGPAGTELASFAVGETVKIGSHEMVVLEQRDGETALIRKDLLPERIAFGTNNNFKGSFVEAACKSFAEEIAAAAGEENIVLHDVDLTSDDGLDDLGQATGCRASLLTANMYRRYVRVLDKHKVDNWWWLATAFSIPPHDQDNWVKCVSPSGYVLNSFNSVSSGVRPFCILKSNIFVSK